MPAIARNLNRIATDNPLVRRVTVAGLNETEGSTADEVERVCDDRIETVLSG
jgi:hypothetical protein